MLFNDTIMYNIGYGGVHDPEIKKMLSDPTREEDLINAISESAKRSQIHDFVMGKLKGYREKVGERGLKLSGGEKQRVAIARALLKNTAIMCFDEATSALDTVTEQEIQKAIEEVSRGCTTLMIAHRLSTVRNCDLIIVLKQGQIVEQGTHDELLREQDGYYRALWERQSELSKREIEERAKKELHDKELEQAIEDLGAKKLQKVQSIDANFLQNTLIEEEDEDESKKSVPLKNGIPDVNRRTIN